VSDHGPGPHGRPEARRFSGSPGHSTTGRPPFQSDSRDALRQAAVTLSACPWGTKQDGFGEPPRSRLALKFLSEEG
jgi:hypothetical protein